VHLPLAPIRALLAALEPALRPWLPLTAGQLATFANDGVPAASAFAASHAAARSVLSADALAPAGEREADDVLRGECRTFADHLLGHSASPALCERYLRQQRALGLDAPTGFEALLVRLARRGGVALALADSYAGWLARHSVLRTKLVGVLALLETAPDSYAAVDAPDASLAWPRLVARGVAEALTAFAAAVLLLPLRALLGRR
jgi:hypothetical protein